MLQLTSAIFSSQKSNGQPDELEMRPLSKSVMKFSGGSRRGQCDLMLGGPGVASVTLYVFWCEARATSYLLGGSAVASTTIFVRGIDLGKCDLILLGDSAEASVPTLF
jgi:hypothetical protein